MIVVVAEQGTWMILHISQQKYRDNATWLPHTVVQKTKGVGVGVMVMTPHSLQSLEVVIKVGDFELCGKR